MIFPLAELADAILRFLKWHGGTITQPAPLQITAVPAAYTGLPGAAWREVILSLVDSTAARFRHEGNDRITCLIFRRDITKSMAKQLFGTDGIRGVPGEEPLDDATLDRVGLALGEYVSSQRGVRRMRGRAC